LNHQQREIANRCRTRDLKKNPKTTIEINLQEKTPKRPEKLHNVGIHSTAPPEKRKIRQFDAASKRYSLKQNPIVISTEAQCSFNHIEHNTEYHLMGIVPAARAVYRAGKAMAVFSKARILSLNGLA
jgi:hypothetical protein